MQFSVKDRIIELIDAVRIGWFSGKANKFLRKGLYKNALRFYESALKYPDNRAGRAALLECAAKSALLTGDKGKAISYLKESLLIYQNYKNTNSLLDESFKRATKNLAELEAKEGGYRNENGVGP